MDLNCRVCLQVNNVMLSLFEEVDQYQMTLGELLQSCGDLKVDKNDCFPKYLCQQCTRELITVADFRKKCKKSKDVLELISRDMELVQTDSTSKNFTGRKQNLRDFDVNENSISIQSAEDCDSNLNDLSREIMELESELLGAEQKIEPILYASSASYKEELDLYDDMQVEHSFSDIKAGTEPFVVQRHTNDENMTCKLCNKMFYTRSNLNVHMQNHSNFRPHLCEVCQKSFKRKETLQAHIRLHTGERPFKCDFCSSSFVQRCDLTYHKISIHTDKRRFKCTICPKTFMKRTYLERHKITHEKKKKLAHTQFIEI